MAIWMACKLGSAHTMAHLSPVGPCIICIRMTTLTVWFLDLDAEYLSLSSGVIWAALNVDYPGHSFSHLGVFFGLSFSLYA